MPAEEPVRREDLETGVGGRDEDDHHPVGARLGGVGDRGLVAVVAVGDQELAVGEELSHAGAVEAPQARALGRQVGLAVGHGDGRLAVVEEEDRLELRAGGAQEPQTALLRAGVRALVRKDRAGLVGLDPQRGDEPAALPRDAVGTDVVLRDRPHGGRVLGQENALVEPCAEEPPGLVLGVVQRQVHDVVGVAAPGTARARQAR